MNLSRFHNSGKNKKVTVASVTVLVAISSPAILMGRLTIFQFSIKKIKIKTFDEDYMLI